MRNPKLVFVLNSDNHSENASVGPLCNPWPIQLYLCPVLLQGCILHTVYIQPPYASLWLLLRHSVGQVLLFTVVTPRNVTIVAPFFIFCVDWGHYHVLYLVLRLLPLSRDGCWCSSLQVLCERTNPESYTKVQYVFPQGADNVLSQAWSEGVITQKIMNFSPLNMAGWRLRGRVCVCSVNSYPANWSEEKAKKESKKSCKNYLGVADFKRIVRGICTKSNSHKQWAEERA